MMMATVSNSTPTTQGVANAGTACTIPNCMPTSAATRQPRPPPPNMASALATGGALRNLRSMMFTIAKLKPPNKPSASAKLSGTGQGESGVFSTTTMPPSAKTNRATAPVLGFSPRMGQANNTTHAGIR